MRATPPCTRMSAGTRSSAMTATAPASSAILACSGVTTSMITPPFSISAIPRFTRAVPCCWPALGVAETCWSDDTAIPLTPATVTPDRTSASVPGRRSRSTRASAPCPRAAATGRDGGSAARGCRGRRRCAPVGRGRAVARRRRGRRGRRRAGRPGRGGREPGRARWPRPRGRPLTAAGVGVRRRDDGTGNRGAGTGVLTVSGRRDAGVADARLRRRRRAAGQRRVQPGPGRVDPDVQPVQPPDARQAERDRQRRRDEADQHAERHRHGSPPHVATRSTDRAPTPRHAVTAPESGTLTTPTAADRRRPPPGTPARRRPRRATSRTPPPAPARRPRARPAAPGRRAARQRRGQRHRVARPEQRARGRVAEHRAERVEVARQHRRARGHRLGQHDPEALPAGVRGAEHGGRPEHGGLRRVVDRAEHVHPHRGRRLRSPAASPRPTTTSRRPGRRSRASASSSTAIPLRGSSKRPTKTTVSAARGPRGANAATSTPLGISIASPPRWRTCTRRADGETAIRCGHLLHQRPDHPAERGERARAFRRRVEGRHDRAVRQEQRDRGDARGRGLVQVQHVERVRRQPAPHPGVRHRPERDACHRPVVGQPRPSARRA